MIGRDVTSCHHIDDEFKVHVWTCRFPRPRPPFTQRKNNFWSCQHLVYWLLQITAVTRTFDCKFDVGIPISLQPRSRVRGSTTISFLIECLMKMYEKPGHIRFTYEKLSRLNYERRFAIIPNAAEPMWNMATFACNSSVLDFTCEGPFYINPWLSTPLCLFWSLPLRKQIRETKFKSISRPSSGVYIL